MAPFVTLALAGTVASAAPPAPAPAAPPSTAAAPTSVDAFHDLLSPLWHAPAGAARTADTCAAAPALRTGAEAMVASPPAKVRSGYAPGTTAVLEALRALDAACSTADKAGLDEQLGAVHDAFHTVAACVE
jgi:hypothetical protein